MKRILIFILIAIGFILLFTNCNSKNEENKTISITYGNCPNNKTIGFSVAGFSTPYFRVLLDYSKLEAIKQDLNLVVMDAEWNSNKQISQIESLINQRVDAICVIPINSKNVIPAFIKVKEAGIPLIDVNVQNEPEANNIIDTFVGASMEEEAELAADSIMKLLGSKGGNVVMLEGAEGNFAAIHRTIGFEETIKRNPNIKLIATAYTGWDKTKAREEMEKILTKFKKIDALYAHDDNIAIGAIEAIKATGRAGEFPIASISGNIDGYEAVRRGEIFSTVSQPPDWEGITAVKEAIKLINGENVDKWVKTPVKLVTRENVSNFKGLW